MVRNAVDHGIEPAAQRAASGKPAIGTVTLKASHQAGQVVSEISDDGKGLAADKIAASSVGKGLVTREQVQNMSEREKMALVFLPAASPPRRVARLRGPGSEWPWSKTRWAMPKFSTCGTGWCRCSIWRMRWECRVRRTLQKR